jgi:biotin carboxyl carrier protein
MTRQRFVGTFGDKKRDIELESLGDGRYAIALDGKEHVVDARRFAGGNWSVLIDGQSYDVELEVAGESESDGAYNALIRGRVISPLVVRDERHVRMGATSRKLKVEGPQIVASPMPGKVVKILVEVGQAVSDGQPLIIVEAMKMENELRAPTHGKVARIMVSAGQAVEAHAKLIALE